MPRLRAFVLLVTGMLLCGSALPLLKHGAWGLAGARVYYDAVHGARHLWNRDNRRWRTDYHTVSGYRRLIRAMEDAGCEVHAEEFEGLTRDTLNDYDVVWIGEQTYHARFMTGREQKVLMDWVADGGGLFLTVEHTNAHYMGDVINEQLQGTKTQARFDSIADTKTAHRSSPTWVGLRGRDDHPVSAGVQEYRFYNGASLKTDDGILFSSDTSWSDVYNPKDRPVHNGDKARGPDEMAGPLAGAAAFEHGDGRIVIVGDHNAFSNPNLYVGDHVRFVEQALAWLAGPQLNLALIPCLLALGFFSWFLFTSRSSRRLSAVLNVTAGAALWLLLQLAWAQPQYDLLLHTGNRSAMPLWIKANSAYKTLYGHWTKEPQLRPWASRHLSSGRDALILGAPRRAYAEDQLEIIDGYLRRGKTVVYLASLSSLKSEAGAQLQEHFDFEVELDHDFDLKLRRPMNVHGPRSLTEGIFRIYADRRVPRLTVSGLDVSVYLTLGGWHVEDRRWRSKKHIVDLVSERRVGLGRFVLVSPMRLFNDSALKGLYKDSDVGRQQAGELMIRVIKEAVGDSSPPGVDDI